MYEVQQSPIEEALSLDADPRSCRMMKIIKANQQNRISREEVSYNFAPGATPLLLADPKSVQYQRLLSKCHHLWVTRYEDIELYFGSRYTFQSQEEIERDDDAVARKDALGKIDVVVMERTQPEN